MESCLPEIKKKIQNFIKLYQLPTIRTLRNSNEFFVPLRVRIIESLLYIHSSHVVILLSPLTSDFHASKVDNILMQVYLDMSRCVLSLNLPKLYFGYNLFDAMIPRLMIPRLILLMIAQVHCSIKSIYLN